MRKYVLLAAVIAVLAGCGGNGESGGGGNGGPDLPSEGFWPQGPVDYVFNISTLDEHAGEGHALVDCSVIAYSGTQVVTITDQHGRTQPLSLHYPDLRTPHAIDIVRADEADRIEVLCKMYAAVGYSLHCEAVTARGRPAPMFDSVDYAQVMLEGLPVACSANINVRA